MVIHHTLRQNSEKKQGVSIAEIRQSDYKLRKLAMELKNRLWQEEAVHMQWLANSNQLGEFYSEVRKLIGLKSPSKVPLKSMDGKDLLKSKEAMLKRWAEHFNTLLID